MSWLRANYRHVAFLVLLAATVFSLVGRAGALARAEVHEARADSLAVEEAAWREMADARGSRLSAINDSLALVRADLAQSRAEAEQRTQGAQIAGREALDSARARATAEVDAYLDEHERQDSVMVAGYEEQIRTLEADTVALSLAVAEERALSELRLQGWDASRAEVASLRAANDALRRAVAPSFLARIADSWEVAALGVVVGAVGWELAR